MEFGIEKWTMIIRKSGKREITEGIELPNKKNRNAGRKGKLQVLGNIRSGHHQTEMKEKLPRVLQTSEKTSLNQTLLQKSHKRDKHLGSPSWRVLGTILRMNKGRTSTNEPEDKKVDDDAQSLTSRKDIDRLTICVKKRMRKRTC